MMRRRIVGQLGDVVYQMSLEYLAFEVLEEEPHVAKSIYSVAYAPIILIGIDSFSVPAIKLSIYAIETT